MPLSLHRCANRRAPFCLRGANLLSSSPLTKSQNPLTMRCLNPQGLFPQFHSIGTPVDLLVTEQVPDSSQNVNTLPTSSTTKGHLLICSSLSKSQKVLGEYFCTRRAPPLLPAAFGPGGTPAPLLPATAPAAAAADVPAHAASLRVVQQVDAQRLCRKGAGFLERMQPACMWLSSASMVAEGDGESATAGERA